MLVTADERQLYRASALSPSARQEKGTENRSSCPFPLYLDRAQRESSCRAAKRLPKQTWSADAASLLTGNANYLRESIVDTDVSRVYDV